MNFGFIAYGFRMLDFGGLIIGEVAFGFGTIVVLVLVIRRIYDSNNNNLRVNLCLLRISY